MNRYLLAVCVIACTSPLTAEEVDQLVLDEISEIRNSLTLGESVATDQDDSEAFRNALVEVAKKDAEKKTCPRDCDLCEGDCTKCPVEGCAQCKAKAEPEACPNGGSCCENAASKVIAKALGSQLFSSPPITPPDVVHPGQPVPGVQNNWHPDPLPGAIDTAQMPAAPRQPDWANPQPPWGGWSNNFRPQPQSSSHHKIHALRETAFELDRIAHRLEMTNLFEAADEIRETACELREEARELIEGDHQDDDHHDHDHDEEHDHDN